MHGIYADARFNELDLDTKSQWIGRGKYLSHSIQTVHDSRAMHDIYARVRLDDLDFVIDFRNVCKARPLSFFLLGGVFVSIA